MTPRERLGLGLVRRMLARLSLAARVQDLEQELHAARNAAQTAELQRARAALRAEQMEREAVDLRTMWQGAEADAEDLRKLEDIDLEVDGRALTKGAQVRMVGNSVSPWPAAQLVRAQFQARAAAEVA